MEKVTFVSRDGSRDVWMRGGGGGPRLSSAWIEVGHMDKKNSGTHFLMYGDLELIYD